MKISTAAVAFIAALGLAACTTVTVHPVGLVVDTTPVTICFLVRNASARSHQSFPRPQAHRRARPAIRSPGSELAERRDA